MKRCGDAGWLHRLRDSDEQRTRQRTRRVVLPVARAQQTNFGKLAERYHSATNPFDLLRLASELGVSREALMRLRVGWDGAAWTFPMRNAVGVVTGIRRRFADGRKLSVRGGREGLFIPADSPDDELLLVCEGPTDAAALLTLGFAAVGRPSCSGGVRLVCDFVRGRDVVVVADGDEPGQRGAAALASVLRLYCTSVRLIGPPDGVKDARACVQSGATRDDMVTVIQQSRSLALAIRSTA